MLDQSEMKVTRTALLATIVFLVYAIGTVVGRELL